MRLLPIAALVFAGGAVACGSSSGSASSGNEPPTFTKVYQDILGPKCGNVCHMPGGPGVSDGLLDMSTQASAYKNLVNVAAMDTACVATNLKRVDPGMPEMSLTFLKVSETKPPCGGRMPLETAPLSAAEIDEIQAWVMAGAMNN
jgi:hypothetical protein